MSFFGVMSQTQFLEEYWQKKPLFIKGAFKDYPTALLSMEEIAGLSLEEEIPSRLVLEDGGEKPWELMMGPLDEATFSQLPKEKWMLVVNDVEKFIPDLKVMVEPFEFIPRWRLDDLQVSLAEDLGNVGAHWDDYDVFLIQGEGKKRWQISYAEVSEDDYKKGVDIRLIENFQVDEEWIVEEGDLLYLPPRIGHYGISLGRSVTWSVGFRMPKVNAMLDDFTHMLIDRIETDLRLTDPNLKVHASRGEITTDALENVLDTFKANLSINHDSIREWFGQYMSLPKMNQDVEPLEKLYTADDLYALIEEEGELETHSGQAYLYHQSLNAIWFYVDGKQYQRPLADAAWIIEICDNGVLDAQQLRLVVESDEVGNNESESFILELINDGYLIDYQMMSELDELDEFNEEYE